MITKLITTKIVNDPYTNEIPLSHLNYSNNSFSGYIKYNNDLVTIARIYVNKTNKSAELADVYLIEKYRGKLCPNGMKWSNLILNSILNAVKRRKIKKVWLWTTKDNIPAIKLYEKFNFVEQIFPIKLKKKIYEKYKWLKGHDLIYMIINL